MIPKVDVVATEVEDNVLNEHTAIGLDTPVIDAINYMADLLVLLIWLSLLIIQHVRVLSQGAHPHLRGSLLRPVNMRSTFVSLKQPNLLPLLLLPRPVMSLLTLHIYLHLGSLIQVGSFSVSCLFKMVDDGFLWAFTGVYGPVEKYHKETFWEELGSIKGLWEEPWCVGGDFNAILYPGERATGGRIDNSMRRFSEILNDLGLRDLPLQGGPYT